MRRPTRRMGNLYAELVTNPDVVEMAEDLAEQFRSSLYENDHMDERMLDILCDQGVAVPGLDGNSAFDEKEYEKLEREMERAEDIFSQALRELLRPMLQRVLDEGDWRIPE